MLLAAEGDYRKVGNGTTTRALRFVSILKSHHSSNRSHQGHGKRRKASGRSCLSAFATACTTAGRTSAGICATAASSRYAEASARCLSARSRRSGVRRTTLNESLMARQTVRCGLRALPSCAPINRDHAREHDRKSEGVGKPLFDKITISLHNLSLPDAPEFGTKSAFSATSRRQRAVKDRQR